MGRSVEVGWERMPGWEKRGVEVGRDASWGEVWRWGEREGQEGKVWRSGGRGG